MTNALRKLNAILAVDDLHHTVNTFSNTFNQETTGMPFLIEFIKRIVAREDEKFLSNVAFLQHVPILLTKIIATQNELALSNHRVRGLYFLTVVFAVTIAQ